MLSLNYIVETIVSSSSAVIVAVVTHSGSLLVSWRCGILSKGIGDREYLEV